MQHLSGKVVLVVAAIAIAAIFAAAQAPAQKPSFEVATIKPRDPGTDQVAIQTPPEGRFRAINVTAKLLIRYAYRVQNSQILGGANWISSGRFDIEAKADTGEVSPAQMPDLVQQLLADRFHLEFHNEMKEMPVFELAVAKGGSKLQSADEPKRPIPGDAAPVPSREGMPRAGGFRSGPGQMSGSAVPLATLAQALSQSVGRPVIDRTNLAGFFTFTLNWTPDQLRVPDTEPKDSNGPDLVTALQEQLGLKLESAKGPVQVFVIDSVQKPSEN